MSPGDPNDRPRPAADPTELRADDAPAGHPFPVVGVGASAGGLEAFTDLLAHLPAKPGLSILFVLHLEPHHKSHLAEVLGKKTGLPIRQAIDGMPVEADHIYLIPPDANLALSDGQLALSP